MSYLFFCMFAFYKSEISEFFILLKGREIKFRLTRVYIIIILKSLDHCKTRLRCFFWYDSFKVDGSLVMGYPWNIQRFSLHFRLFLICLKSVNISKVYDYGLKTFCTNHYSQISHKLSNKLNQPNHIHWTELKKELKGKKNNNI